MLDMEKVIANGYHVCLILLSAYIAAHPAEYAWLIPALQTLGQTAPPPDFTPGLRLEQVPHA
jgi:hypothetical protein